MRHELKSWPKFFYPVWDGAKEFEVRRDDRNFKVLDSIILREHLDGGIYTGREVGAVITYILRSADFEGVAPGYCVLGFRTAGRRG